MATSRRKPTSFTTWAGRAVHHLGEHRLGVGDLLDAVHNLFRPRTTPGSLRTYPGRRIGKPNAGKSSLINTLLGENRLIVSDVPGTTRDAVDTQLDNAFGSYTLIDTAGLRKKSRIDTSIEKYSMIRSLAAIERADVCLILIDATQGATEQDTKVAGFAHNKGKASILIINKWDLVEKETGTLESWQISSALPLPLCRTRPSSPCQPKRDLGSKSCLA